VGLIKEVAIAAFGAPAALSVLAKLDKRLDLLPYIERVVLGFETFSAAIWKFIFRSLSFEIPVDTNLLTLVVLLAAPALPLRRFLANETQTQDNARLKRDLFFWRCLSGVFIVSAAIAFAGRIFAIFGLAVISPLLIFSAIRVLYFKKQQSSVRGIWTDFITQQSSLISKSIIGAFIQLMIYLTALIVFFYMGFIENINVLLSSFLVWYILSIGIVYVVERPKAIAYSGLWVTGIVTINYLSGTLLPTLDKFLRSVGV
jgi:hypothetical protein